MRINHNMAAVIANDQLLSTEDKLSKSLERLSSGLKINSAEDNPTGLAISNKMKAQIRGLDQSSNNAQDGISVIETAEGGLTEITSMLARLKELTVQAGNDTNTDEERQAIQDEVDSMLSEIDRISSDTEFNKQKLLNGNLSRRSYTDSEAVTASAVADSVNADEYGITITQDARQAVLVGDVSTLTTVSSAMAGTVSVNGVSVAISAGDDADAVYEKIRSAAEKGDVNVIAVSSLTNTGTVEADAGYTAESFATGKQLVFISDDYGSQAEVAISCDNPALATALGLIDTSVQGTDAQVDFTLDGFGNYIGYDAPATISTMGNEVTVTDRGGFSMELTLNKSAATTSFTDSAINTGSGTLTAGSVGASTSADVLIDVTDIGTMTLQVGANEGQEINLGIRSVDTKSMGLDDVNLLSTYGIEKALTAVDDALSYVSEVRSKIGAYQNRLEHAGSSLDVTSENMTAALSRIVDVDMAEEMSTYTQYNVLSQAATSVLAQANDMPQQVLQLLQ